MYGIVFRGHPDLRPILLYGASWGTRCARTTRSSASSRSCRYRKLTRPTRGHERCPTPIRARLRPRAAATTRVVVNIGPSHPATHGTVQIIAELDGETREARRRALRLPAPRLREGVRGRTPGTTSFPYVDRLNYCSALINNFAYCEAVEKLMGVEITPRCRYLRTLLSEYSRIADHLTCIAASLMELGAMTRVPLPGDGPRLHVRAPRGADRRARDLHLRAHRRARARPARRLARRASSEILDQYEDVRRPRARARWTATASSSTACATSA